MKSRVTAAWRAFHILLLTFALTGVAYWHWGLLPGQLKQVPIDAIRKATGLDADFKRVYYIPFHGILIDRPVLRSKTGQELFRAGSIRLQTDLPVYLRDNRIVIQKIEVDSAVSEFRLPAANAASRPTPGQAPSVEAGAGADAAGQPEVTHPFMVLEAVFDDSFLPSNVYLNELMIRHGKISILPASGSNQPIEVLRDIRFRTILERRPLIPVEADFRTSFGRGDFHAEGLVNLTDGQHRLALTGRLEHLPGWVTAPLAAKKIHIPQLKGDVSLELNYDGVSLMRFTLASKKLLTEADWDSRSLNGVLSGRAAGSYNFLHKKLIVSDGLFETQALTVKGISESVPEVKITAASVAWNPELIEIPRVQGIWQNTSFTLEGTIDRAEGHGTKLEFRQSLPDLEAYRPFAAKLFSGPINPGSLQGKLKIAASLTGPLRDLARNINTIRIEMRDASLAPKMLKSIITDLNGALDIRDMRVLGVEDLFFRHAKEDYTLSGEIDTAPGGIGRFHLKQKKWEADARFRIYSDRLEFSTFALESGPSHAGATGTLRNFTSPVIDATFRAHLITERLAADWQDRLLWLKNVKLKGTVDAAGALKGPIQTPAALHLVLKANSTHLTYADMFVFGPVETDLTFDAGILNISYAKAGFYDGEARLTAKADFTDPTKPYFESHFFTQGTNLAKFCDKLSFIKNKFSGILNTDVVVGGYLNDVKSLKGHGSFRASEGQLWETELFKRLQKVAFLTIEGIDKLLFKTADGSFTIGGGGIQAEDCTLSSSAIDVHFSGRIGFDSKLALNVISRFTSNIIRETYEVGGLAPALMNIAEHKITPYIVSGTLKDPKFTPQT